MKQQKIFKTSLSFLLILLGMNFFFNFFPFKYEAMALALGWGYVWGSLVGGPLFARLFHLGSLHAIGSGNIGTTNVLRTGHKGAACLTLVFDALKAVVSIKTIMPLLSIHYTPLYISESIYPLLTAFGTCLGHLYPLFYHFKGGKGIATLGGVHFALCWFFGLIMVGIWLLTAWISRYSSLAGLVMVILAIPLSYIFINNNSMLFYITIAPFIIFRHKDNIKRLQKGHESKINVTPK